jgi:hypothetical protein
MLTGTVEFVPDPSPGYRVWRCLHDPSTSAPFTDVVSVCWMKIEWTWGWWTWGWWTWGWWTWGWWTWGWWTWGWWTWGWWTWGWWTWGWWTWGWWTWGWWTPSSIGTGKIIPKPLLPPVVSPPVLKNFTHALRRSIERFESSCTYTDINYREIVFQDILWNPDQEAIKTLQAYCIVKWYTYTHNTKFHTQAATSIWEAIKVLAKIAAMDEWIVFDEFGWYTGRLPYSDMLPNAWYTPYVVYAHEKWYLDWITWWKVFWRGELKALTPITKKQFTQLLENFWKKSPEKYLLYMHQWKYVMRDDMASIVVDMFADELVDYKYLYGNNTIFYRWILSRLENKSNQKAYLQSLINNLKKRDADMMWWKYNLDVEWIISFLEKLISE